MTAPRLTGGHCQCASCGDPFSSVREFDRHRIGAFAEPGEWAHKRRCMTPSEMEALGWRCNVRGFRMQPRPQRAPAGVEGSRMTLPAREVAGAQR
jgi:hypothetical protein